MIVVLFGVAGSGKSTVGIMLASAMNCAFLEGDALHPPANVDKMSRGIPLTNDDRGPWLAAIRARIVEFSRRGDDLVVACSALKQNYRDFLAARVPITWIFLKASEELSRFRQRHGEMFVGTFGRPDAARTIPVAGLHISQSDPVGESARVLGRRALRSA